MKPKFMDLLVVDDEAIVLALLVDLLESAGHRVDVASDGVQAMRFLDEKRGVYRTEYSGKTFHENLGL